MKIPLTSTCKHCLQPIGWRQLKSGKWRPVEANGRSHFKVCGKTEAELKEEKRQLKARLRAARDLKAGLDRVMQSY
jgi:uncharacterized protein YifE (UPF0438 family)